MLAQPVPQPFPRAESCLRNDRPATGLTPNRTNPEVLPSRAEPT